jgi:hypothetical protein
MRFTGEVMSILTLSSVEVKTIKDVVHFPGLHKKLLSIGQTADRGHTIVFDRDKCVVISKSSPHERIA